MMIILINIAFVLVLPFLFTGVINKTKSFWAGRIGPGFFQSFFDFIKLLHKGEVISTATTFVFQIAPAMGLAAVILALLVTPMAGNQSFLSFKGDFIVFAYALGLSKFFSVIGAMDTGSSFEGMGASREASFTSIVEPAFFILLASITAISGGISFSNIMGLFQKRDGFTLLLLVLSVITLFLMLLIEGCRVPVDDPNTHLELTMIHEVMVLDNSGPDLALINYGASLKMVLIGSLIANIILSGLFSFPIHLLLWFIIITVIAVVIGTIESLLARLRMTHIPQFVFLMTSISLIVLSAVALFSYGGLK